MQIMTDESSDSLFNEATDEMQSDIVDHITDAEDSLPSAGDVWDTDGDNILGVLNQVQSALDVEDARSSYKEARKWYLLGVEADAFAPETETAFEDRLGEIQTTIEQVESVEVQLNDLTPEFPELRGALTDLDESSFEDTLGSAEDGDVGASDSTDNEETESDTETEGDGDESDGEDSEGEGGDEGDVVDESDTDSADEESDDSVGAAESWGTGSDDDDAESTDDQSSLA